MAPGRPNYLLTANKLRLDVPEEHEKPRYCANDRRGVNMDRHAHETASQNQCHEPSYCAPRQTVIAYNGLKAP